MRKNTDQLYFDYPSNAKIRIKKSNVFKNDTYPALYAIKTKKLAFVIPRVAVRFIGNHAYIPLHIYREKLTNYYLTIKNNP